MSLTYAEFLQSRGVSSQLINEWRAVGGCLHSALLENMTEDEALGLAAEFTKAKVVDLAVSPCEPFEPDIAYARHSVAPWSNGQFVTWRPPTQELKDFFYSRYSANYSFVYATKASVTAVIQERCGVLLLSHIMSNEIDIDGKELSARFSRAHILSLLALMVLCGIVYPKMLFDIVFFIAACSTTMSLCFKAICSIYSIRNHPQDPKLTIKTSLSTFTIILPLYGEELMFPQIVSAVCALDYPSWLLDVKIVLEHDDVSMLELVNSTILPYNFEILVVPKSTSNEVRTKARACNYALLFARGQYTTIFDAEDIPDIDQLKKVAASHNICMQSRLAIYNRETNLLTKMFSIEYDVWYRANLRGISRAKLPLPLCGSSNYVNTEFLRSIGTWDIYNVTEDAELGMRVYVHGHGVRLIDSNTQEEAPSSLRSWLTQRTRWMKGFVITYISYVRIMPPGILSMTAMLLSPYLSQISGVLLIILGTLLWIMDIRIDPFYLWLAFALLGTSITVHTVQLIICRCQMRLVPIYILYVHTLHPIAALRATWQLFFSPYTWEKTPHISPRS